jgi:heme-degrading monooxygenase HmoA
MKVGALIKPTAERNRMSYLMIRHKVANYGKWKRAVNAFKKFRKTSGEKSFYVCRGSKNPNDLIVFCGWDSASRMRNFVRSAELRRAMKEAGVISRPEVTFFSKMEDLSLA